MKKIITLLVLTFITITLFAQKDRDASILKLMNVKKGMVSVNTLADSMSKDMDNQKTANFKAEMNTFKENLITEAIAKFKTDYTAIEINSIYEECTSDKIDYTDLTNGFFKKWRKLKGDLYFSKAKTTYFKYQK